MSITRQPVDPIGLFDSGIGGLSVLREVANLLPQENLVYLADNAHCPYGPRPVVQIQHLSRAISQFLLEQQAKLIVVACNTASAAALVALRATFAVPFVGMVPAVKPAAILTRRGIVGVLATPVTSQGALLANVISTYGGGVETIVQPCPGLVEFVERGEWDSPQLRQLLHTYVSPLVARGADVLVLGCTHYPLLLPVLQEVAGPEVRLVDPSPAVARQVQRLLADSGLLNTAPAPPSLRAFTTGPAEPFAALAQRLLDRPMTTTRADLPLSAIW
ncbi:MAG: glutamate racemase [Chloroflexi bacterium]|nr:glutamate racemase [Chloroflexota bacterium]